MNANHTPTFENLSLRSVTDCIELAPLLPVPGAFHDAPRASAIRSRSLQWVLSTARGVTSKLLSSGPPLTPPSPRQFAHHARATMSSSSAEIAFPALPVKRERLPRPEAPSIETMPTDPRCPCEHPSTASTIPRFCHRGSPSDASSPGAVSRFGLAPVHPRRRSNARFFGRDVVVRLLQHDTKCRLTAR